MEECSLFLFLLCLKEGGIDITDGAEEGPAPERASKGRRRCPMRAGSRGDRQLTRRLRLQQGTDAADYSNGNNTGTLGEGPRINLSEDPTPGLIKNRLTPSKYLPVYKA